YGGGVAEAGVRDQRTFPVATDRSGRCECRASRTCSDFRRTTRPSVAASSGGTWMGSRDLPEADLRKGGTAAGRLGARGNFAGFYCGDLLKSEVGSQK